MSEQRRDLSEWEYLVFFVRNENSPLWRWPFAKDRKKSIATSGGVVLLSIIYITLMCTLLPGQAPHITLPVEQPPLKTRLITFAFNTIRYDNKSTAMQISSQLDEGAVIKRVIETLNNDIVGFAFEVSDGKGDMTIHEYGSSADALAALDSLLQIQLTNQNPNQTAAILVYTAKMSNNQALNQSYVFFAAPPDHYATYADFVNDIKTAMQLAAGLSTSNIKAMLVAPSEVTSITPSSGLCVIDNTKVDINKIVDAIANYTSSTIAECPMDISSTATTTPATLTTSSTLLNTTITSVATETSTTTTVAFSTTVGDTTTSPTAAPTMESDTTASATVPSTTTVITAPASTTTNAETTTTVSTTTTVMTSTSSIETTSTTLSTTGILYNSSTSTSTSTKPTTITTHEIPITPSTSTESTEGTTTQPLPSPPCFGDFVFVVDGSTTTVTSSEAIVDALHYITNDWNMDGTDGLRISGTVSGVDDLFGGFLPENFVKTKDDWTNEIVRIKSYLSAFYAGQTTSPISLSKALEEIYCKEGAENQVLRQNNVTFVIFTSWSDDSGINAALSQQTPWLHCSLAKSQSIFMVAINGGSLNLAKLALPSKELFIDMGDFKEVPMSSLVNKIILTTCECATQQDGTLPAGCPLSESVIH